MRHLIPVILILFNLSACQNTPNQPKKLTDTPPAWAKDVIWYQIFVERFNNGDSSNDPSPETMYAASNFIETPQNWSVTSWTQEWYQEEEWARKDVQDFYANLQLRRYGGDLQGVLNKLDYIQDLGITAIYFNPLNDAPSLHKYDARNYHHIDVTFGPDPKGDMEIMASEDPNDPSTWKWTSADKLFLKVIDECHKRNIRVVLDYSWNHTGVEFWAWKDIIKNQGESKYKDWYKIKSFDDPTTEENEFEYEGWLNIMSLPALTKVNTQGEHKPGHPFEGDLHPEVKKHVYDVTKRWLAPNGDVSKGLDGYRLDVADHIPMGFWRDYYKYVKSINPEAYLVGEIWWEEWPDKLMNPVPYLRGGVFDAVMHYQVYRPARYFFAKSDYQIDAAQLVDSLNYQWGRISDATAKGMMNVAATHDTPRLLTSFANPGKYKYKAKPNDDENYITGKPDEETYRRVKLYLLHQFTSIGAPHIWNGDEMGMWGSDDPDCRKPLWWPEYTFDDENKNSIHDKEPEYVEVGFNADLHGYYKQMTKLRNENLVLKEGSIEFVKAEGSLLVYNRINGNEKVLVVLNAGEKGLSYEFSSGKKYMDILSGEIFEGNQMLVEGISGHVLKEVEN
ncbi:glycoside hydrolase family 13 protein [Saccharicrinis sp. 156]|uniref:glycoside hydrolase family 13 protein n=1 Tax=Saccharicrinis sp. 156 TaxID=3417574 RepID=UPI003D339A17